MESFLHDNGYDDLQSLQESVRELRIKNEDAIRNGKQRDAARHLKALEVEETILLNAVKLIPTSSSSSVSEILAGIGYDDVDSLVTDIREKRYEVQRHTSNNKQRNANRVAQELIELENNFNRICLSDGKVNSTAQTTTTTSTSPPVSNNLPTPSHNRPTVKDVLLNSSKSKDHSASQNKSRLRKWSPRANFTITVVQGDVVQQGTQGVVNAANQHLQHGAGVAGAVRKVGGAEVVQESSQWVAQHGIVPVGGVAVTGAGKIAGARKVIHAVGPHVLRAGSASKQEAALLKAAIDNALRAAKECGLRNVSVPAISTGIFGFPLQLGAQILVDSACRFAATSTADSALREIRFVGFTTEDCVAFETALAGAAAGSTNAGEDEHTTAAASAKFSAALPNPAVLSKDCSQKKHHLTPPKVKTSIKKNTSPIVGSPATPSVFPGVLFNPSESDVAGFKAAGVILWRVVHGELRLLIGEEWRAEGKVLNFLGGKRDSIGERAERTAAREFCEESGFVIKEDEMHTCLQAADTTCIWYGPGKYVLYIVRCPNAHHNADRVYNRMSVSERGPHAEMASLLWVRLEDLLSAVRGKAPRSSGLVQYTSRVWQELRTYMLSNFMTGMLRTREIVDTLQLQLESAVPGSLNTITVEISQSKANPTMDNP